MKILSVECSSAPASVCIFENDKIIASSFSNVKLTHSETLLPMIENTLKSAKLKIGDIDGFAVGYGPGSFTGIRIGISAVKGLAAPCNIPCVGVSTLASMAYHFIGQDAVICPVMDARCNQFYNALFKIKSGNVERICDDRAIMKEELINELLNIKESIIICGDGADILYSGICEKQNISLAPVHLKYQSAVGVAFAAAYEFEKGNAVKPSELLPVYLRLPQAERELKLKKEKSKEQVL